MDVEGITSLIGILAAVCVVVLAAYFVTRFLASGARPGGQNPHSLKLIDRFAVSKDKMFVLISAGQSAYLVGVTNQAMTLIDTVDLSEVQGAEQPKQAFHVQGFREGDFITFLNRMKNKAGVGGKTGVGEKDATDDSGGS
jgi:flagellar biogenesis protein FliO